MATASDYEKVIFQLKFVDDPNLREIENPSNDKIDLAKLKSKIRERYSLQKDIILSWSRVSSPNDFIIIEDDSNLKRCVDTQIHPQRPQNPAEYIVSLRLAIDSPPQNVSSQSQLLQQQSQQSQQQQYSLNFLNQQQQQQFQQHFQQPVQHKSAISPQNISPNNTHRNLSKSTQLNCSKRAKPQYPEQQQQQQQQVQPQQYPSDFQDNSSAQNYDRTKYTDFSCYNCGGGENGPIDPTCSVCLGAGKLLKSKEIDAIEYLVEKKLCSLFPELKSIYKRFQPQPQSQPSINKLAQPVQQQQQELQQQQQQQAHPSSNPREIQEGYETLTPIADLEQPKDSQEKSKPQENEARTAALAEFVAVPKNPDKPKKKKKKQFDNLFGNPQSTETTEITPNPQDSS